MGVKISISLKRAFFTPDNNYTHVLEIGALCAPMLTEELQLPSSKVKAGGVLTNRPQEFTVEDAREVWDYLVENGWQNVTPPDSQNPCNEIPLDNHNQLNGLQGGGMAMASISGTIAFGPNNNPSYYTLESFQQQLASATLQAQIQAQLQAIQAQTLQAKKA